jgi:predicted acylesterase/phospholipase RssA
VLKEHGIVPSELLGVSVGAITGMSLMHFDPTLSKQTWAGLTTNMVYEVDEVGLSRSQFRKNLTHNLVSRQYFNKESLREVIRPVVAVELATPRLVDFTLLASEFPILKPVTYTVTDETTVDELTDWILASSAFYPFVSPVEIDGKRYIDGGYTNNVPVDVAAAHGAKEIYAISIMDNVPAASTVPDDVQVTVIRSPWELGPLLDFIPEESARHMRLGELRTRQVLGDLVGYYYAFEPSTSFAWLGGGSLIHWLASDPVTAGVANILSETAVWVAWTQWIGAHAESTVVNNPDAMGLATIERLGELLDVDPLAVYDESSFQTALVKAAKVNRDKLPLPEKAVTTAYVMANLAVVLTAVLYLLSNGQKNGRMVG